MKNNEKTLIEALRGSVENLEKTAEAFEGVETRDENGKLLPFFWLNAEGALELLVRIVDVERRLMQAFDDMITPYAETPCINASRQQADEGKKWSVEEILKHCTLEGNVMKLPAVQFNKKSYAEAKKWIEEAGGQWKGGKVQGFTFPFSPERVFAILKEGKRCNLQQEYQFFETPADVADWLVMLAGGIHEGDTVLEPSAGRGALIKAVHRACPSVTVECYELMPENREFLQQIGNVIILGEDFTKDNEGKYTKIIANPPFSGNQDIDHVRLMYDRLEEGGTLAAITSMHWKIASDKKCAGFREWLASVGGQTYDIDAGEFKESGTGISTTAVVVTKGKE